VSAPIVAGSLAWVARQKHEGLAAARLGVSLVAIVDTSGSMDERDSRGGRRRIDVAREELARLQAEHPGELALLCFSGWHRWYPGGVPPEPDTNTDPAGALRFAKPIDGTGVAFVLISDGLSDDPDDALEVARELVDPISCVHVGPEGDAVGRRFLERPARVGRGTAAASARAVDLADAARRLLVAGS
jgi:hypothetical protein